MADVDDKKKTKKAKGPLTPGANQASREVASFWKEQKAGRMKVDKEWLTLSKAIIQRYRDERGGKGMDGMRRMNCLWMNVKVLKPALYSKTPIPIVERKFLDRDPKARLSSQMLERALKNEIENNGFHGAVSRTVLDYLLCGRGVAWIRYEPEIGEGDSIPATYQNSLEDDLGEAVHKDKQNYDPEKPKPIPQSDDEKAEKLADTNQQLLAERAPVDYIDYRDFKIYPSKARTWSEVQAISKTISLSRRQCIDRFGSEIGSAMRPDSSYEDSSNTGPVSQDQTTWQDINNRNIVVEEIWNKLDRKIYWISTGYEFLCDVKDDFLGLKDFWPVPEPISATLTNDSLVPVPDYQEYQDQAIQVDELTQRIAMLTKACKVAGVYAAENGALGRLLDEGFENQLIAVEDWNGLVEKGGLEGMILYLPIKEIQEVIRTLTEVRQQCIQDMDMITGLSDVIRGTTDSRETLGGIRLKNNNAGTRLTDRQQEVAKFAKDILAIVAEIMSKHYEDETLIEQSGIRFLDELQVETIVAELKAGKNPKKAPPIKSPMAAQSKAMAPGAPPGAPNTGGPPAQPPIPPGPANNAPPMAGPPQPPGPQNMGQGLMPGGPSQPPQPQVDPAVLEKIEELLLKKEAEKIIEDRIKGALELLREDIAFYYRIDIETDSTIFGDQAQERQDATEFLTAVTGFMEKSAMMVQQVPEFGPLAGRFLQWGVRKYRTGRDLESAIDNFVQQMEGMVKDMADNPRPNPEEQKAQMDMQVKQQEMEHQKVLQQMEQQAQQANDQRDVMKQQMEDQRQKELNAMEMQMAEQKMQLEREKMELEKQLMLLKHQLETQKMHMQAQHQERSMQMEAQHQEHTMNLKTQEAQTQHQLAIEQANQQNQLAQQKHTQSMEAQTQKHKLGMEANEQKHAQMKEQATIKAKAAKKPAKAE